MNIPPAVKKHREAARKIKRSKTKLPTLREVGAALPEANEDKGEVHNSITGAFFCIGADNSKKRRSAKSPYRVHVVVLAEPRAHCCEL